jgi:hypothetical protein
MAAAELCAVASMHAPELRFFANVLTQPVETRGRHKWSNVVDDEFANLNWVHIYLNIYNNAYPQRSTLGVSVPTPIRLKSIHVHSVVPWASCCAARSIPISPPVQQQQQQRKTQNTGREIIYFEGGGGEGCA